MLFCVFLDRLAPSPVGHTLKCRHAEWGVVGPSLIHSLYPISPLPSQHCIFQLYLLDWLFFNKSSWGIMASILKILLRNLVWNASSFSITFSHLQCLTAMHNLRFNTGNPHRSGDYLQFSCGDLRNRKPLWSYYLIALDNNDYKLYVKNGHRDNYLSEPEFTLRLRQTVSWKVLLSFYYQKAFIVHTWAVRLLQQLAFSVIIMQ